MPRLARHYFNLGLGGLSLLVVPSCALPQIDSRPSTWNSHSFTTTDGARFAYRKWLPNGHPTAIILAIHGLGGAASDWQPLGERLQRKGIAVFAHELRGMGNDPDRRRRGHVAHRRKWRDDFTTFAHHIQQRYPQTPIFWYGESLGGLIGTNLLADHAERKLRPAGFILASPIVEVDAKLPAWQRAAMSLGALVLPRFRIRLLDLASNEEPAPQVVSSTTHEAQSAQTPHAISHVSLRLLTEIRNLVNENRLIVKTNNVPILVLHGGKDIFTRAGEIEEFFGEIGGIHKERRYFPSGYHLLLHDSGRGEVLDQIENWLEKIKNSCHMDDFLGGKRL